MCGGQDVDFPPKIQTILISKKLVKTREEAVAIASRMLAEETHPTDEPGAMWRFVVRHVRHFKKGSLRSVLWRQGVFAVFGILK